MLFFFFQNNLWFHIGWSIYFLLKTIFLLYNWLITFSCRHLTDIKTLLTQNLLIMQNPDAEHGTCTTHVTIYTITWKTQRAIQKQVHYQSLAKQNWKNKKNCYCYHSSSQTSLSPFWFQYVDNLLFHQRKIFLSHATLCFPYCESQNHYCHTDHQLHKSCHSQTWYPFFCSNSYWFYTYTPDIPICHCVYEVHGLWMSWQFPLFFFEFADQPIIKTLSVILVLAYREQCVHLEV